MNKVYLILFLTFFILLKFTHYVKTDYINVAEMGFQIRDRVPVKYNTDDDDRNNCVCHQDPIHCDMLHSLVNKIPLAALIQAENEEYVDIKIKFGVGELKTLKEFTQGSCESNNEAYRIMNSAIRKMEIITNANQINWTIFLYEFLNHNQEMIVFVLTILLIFLLLIWWWTFSKSWAQVLMKGFILLLVAGSVWNWMRMYKDAQAEKMAMIEKAKGEIPLSCRPKDMGIWDSVVQWFKGSFTFSEDECRKYYKHFTVDVFWDINPLTAVSDVLSRMTLHPLSVIGEYSALFIRELFSRLPVQFWLPVGLFMCAVVFFCIIGCFRYRIRLPFFLLIEPAHPPPNQPALQPALQPTPPPQHNFFIQPAPHQMNLIAPAPQQINQINDAQVAALPQNENNSLNESHDSLKLQTHTTPKETTSKSNIATEDLQECSEKPVTKHLTEEKMEKDKENQNTESLESNGKLDPEKTADQLVPKNNILLPSSQLIPPGNKIVNCDT